MLFPMTKIQILKAIHNSPRTITVKCKVVSDDKDTNFESNSQRICSYRQISLRCFR